MNTLNRKLMLGMALVAVMAFPTDAFAAAKTRAALQTDLDNNKRDPFNVHLDFADKTNINDSMFNLATDGIDAITGVTSTNAELNLLDGSLEANTAASVAAILDTAKALRTDANIGTPGTGVTAVEYGDGFNHVTVLTVTAAALTPTIPADAEGAGAIIYTFPAGVYAGSGIHADLTAVTADSATNAVDFGLGSLIASGDIATLTTAAMEDWLTGQTIADISSPATEKSTIMTGGADLMFEAGDSHVLNLNMAATWNNTVATLDATATITIYWTFLGT